MSTTNPITYSTRDSGWLTAAPGQVDFNLPFGAVQAADLAVYTRPAGDTGLGTLRALDTHYTVPTLTLLGGIVRFTAVFIGGEGVRIKGLRVNARTSGISVGGFINASAAEKEGDVTVMALQELRRDADAALTATQSIDASVATASAAAIAAQQAAADAEADRAAIASMGSFGYDFDTRATAAAGAIAAGKDTIRLGGHTVPGYGAALYVEIGGDPGHGLAFQAPAASGRWWIIAPEVGVTPWHAGGDPANATLTDAAIAAIRAARPGQPIDLGGLEWLTALNLNALEFQPYHGQLRNGSNVRSYPVTPLAHPLAGGSRVTLRLPGHERPYASGLIYRPGEAADTREWIAAITNHKKHVTQPGDTLSVVRSMSGGARWTDSEAIPVPVAEGVMGGSVVGAYGVDNAGIGGKFGFLFTTYDAGGVKRCYFGYSYGNQWVAEQLTALATLTPFFHGRILNVPAAEGGSTTTWIATGYSETAPNQGPHVIVTTNAFSNASTSVYQAKLWGDQGVSDATEPCLAKTGANQYYLVSRRDGGGNLVSAFKSNPAVAGAWGAWTDTNIACGANPFLITDKWGRLFFWVFARRGTPIDGHEDVLLCCSISKSEWHANGGRFLAKPAWTVVVQGLEHLTGYAGYAENALGDPMLLANHNETLTGSANASTSSVCCITPYALPVEAPAIVTRRWNRNTLNPDPALRYAPYGTSLAGIGVSRKMFSPALSFFMTGGTADFTYQDLDARIADAATFSPRNAWRISNSAAGSGRVFALRFYGIEEVRRVCRSGPIAGRIEFAGQIPPYYQAYAYVHPGTGGSPSAALTGTAVNAKQYDYVSGLFSATAVIAPPDISAMVFGTNDDAYLDLYWISNNSGAAFCDLAGLAWWLADQPWEIEPYDLGEELPRILRRVELLAFRASGGEHIATCHEDTGNNGVGSLRFAPKERVPSVALASGTSAGQFTLNGVACSSIAFDRIGRHAARIVAATGGALPDHSMQELYWGSASSGGILINAEGFP